MKCFFEILSLCLSVVLCILCTKSDIQDGLIYNKVLMIFLIAAIVIDVVYYSFFAQALFWDFLFNVLIVAAFSLYLFFSHSFGGGDCKMIIVLSLLYPAEYYLTIKNYNLTFILVLGFAIFAGYIYLLINSIRAIATKKTSITFDYVKNYLIDFLKRYIAAMIYIVLLNSLIILCEQANININIWVSRCACIIIAWCVGHYAIFKNIILQCVALAATVVISLITKIVPISFNPENYIIILVLMLCQMIIRPTIYERINVDQLKKGMILTTLSSVLMQSSITKGLPNVSTEDLKSRLTTDEVESIKIWAKATHTNELTIVKKIPFAIFISIGLVGYFTLWRIFL